MVVLLLLLGCSWALQALAPECGEFALTTHKPATATFPFLALACIARVSRVCIQRDTISI